MTRQELIDFCLMFSAAYEDYPFDDIPDPGAWTVMRHKTNKNSFALIYERNGKLRVNLKCDPFEAGFLRQAFTDVIPGYHINKVHWNTSEDTFYDNSIYLVNKINPYLFEAENICVASRGTPISDVPKATKGNQPSDGGNLILTTEEKEELLRAEP